MISAIIELEVVTDYMGVGYNGKNIVRSDPCLCEQVKICIDSKARIDPNVLPYDREKLVTTIESYMNQNEQIKEIKTKVRNKFLGELDKIIPILKEIFLMLFRNTEGKMLKDGILERYIDGNRCYHLCISANCSLTEFVGKCMKNPKAIKDVVNSNNKFDIQYSTINGRK